MGHCYCLAGPIPLHQSAVCHLSFHQVKKGSERLFHRSCIGYRDRNLLCPIEKHSRNKCFSSLDPTWESEHPRPCFLKALGLMCLAALLHR